MRNITNEERNTCIIITCNYFKTRGIHLVPDMFIETEDDDHKFLMKGTWLEYVLDIEALPIRYTMNISTMIEPDRFVVNITNNGGFEYIDEYETFDFSKPLLQQYISDPEGYKEEIHQNLMFKNWV